MTFFETREMKVIFSSDQFLIPKVMFHHFQEPETKLLSKERKRCI